SRAHGTSLGVQVGETVTARSALAAAASGAVHSSPGKAYGNRRFRPLRHRAKGNGFPVSTHAKMTVDGKPILILEGRPHRIKRRDLWSVRSPCLRVCRPTSLTRHPR